MSIREVDIFNYSLKSVVSRNIFYLGIIKNFCKPVSISQIWSRPDKHVFLLCILYCVRTERIILWVVHIQRFFLFLILYSCSLISHSLSWRFHLRSLVTYLEVYECAVLFFVYYLLHVIMVNSRCLHCS